MTRICIAGSILAALLASGCTTLIPGYGAYKAAASGAVDQAITDRMEWNDKKAEVVRALNCDISLGAYARLDDGDVKKGIGLICGTQPSTPPIVVVTNDANGRPSVQVIQTSPQPTGTDAMQSDFLKTDPPTP